MDDLSKHISQLQFDTAAAAPAPLTTSAADSARGLPGVEHRTESGPFQWIRQPLAEYHRGFAEFEPRLRPVEEDTESAHREIQLLARSVRDGVFFDLETCGFSGSPLFLIGLCRVENGVWVMEQLFARGYDEEAAVLQAFAERLLPTSLLVTFNGKSFDWPFVCDRLVRHRLPAPPKLPHVDLLHLCRRHWSGRFDNYRLQTLEEKICRRRRVADLGGRDVAVAYHDYIRSGHLRDVRRILQHNALDVLTMLELSAALFEPSSDRLVDSNTEVRSAG